MNDCSETGGRIRVLRAALAWSQQQAAERVGVSREMWGKYERGAAAPGADVLASMAAAGFDVLYVITGHRADGYTPEPAPALSHRARALLDNFEHCSEADQAAIARLAASAAQPTSASRRRRN